MYVELKSVIVTGASSGIGRAAAIILVESGYRVFGLARNHAKLAELATLLPLDQYYPIGFDITKENSFEKIVSDIAEKGQIFGLVNSAGYVEPGAIEDLGMASLRTQFETNFFGLVGLTKQVLPHMMKYKEGRIVNVSSMTGFVSLPLLGAYCATKYALEALTDALRMELWSSGIKVVSINPGVIETNLHSITAEKVEQYKNSRFSGAYRKYLLELPGGMPSSVVGEAIMHAITSKKPRHRYLVGSAKEKAGLMLRSLIPDGLFYSQVARRISS